MVIKQGEVIIILLALSLEPSGSLPTFKLGLNTAASEQDDARTAYTTLLAFRQRARFIRDLQPSWEDFEVDIQMIDNMGSSGKAVKGAVELWFSSNSVNAMIGCSWSTLSMAVASLGHTMEQVQMGYSSTNAKLSNKQLYSYFLRTVPPDSLQSLALVKLVQHLNYKRVSWAYVAEPYAEGVYRGFVDYHEGTIIVQNAEPLVNQHGSSLNEDLWKEPISRLMAGAEKIILFASNAGGAHDFVTLALKMGFFTPDRLLINAEGTAAAHINSLTTEQNIDARGSLGVMPKAQGAKWPDYVEFLKTTTKDDYPAPFSTSLWDKFGWTNEMIAEGKVGFYDPFMADAVIAILISFNELLKAGHAVEDIKGKLLLDKLRPLTFEGVSGSVFFNEDGDRLGDYEVFNVDGNGTLKVVGTWGALSGVTFTSPVYYPDGTSNPTLELPPKCPAGSHATPEGCQKCPAGSFGKDEKCELCPRGYFAPHEGIEDCLPCDSNFAAPEEGAAQCQQCTIGKFTIGTGAVECTKCPVGTYGVEDVGIVTGNVTAKSSVLGCVKCPLNAYSDTTGATECKSCGKLQVTLIIGATSISDCTCAAGSYLPLKEDPNTKECKSCPEGMSCAGGIAPPILASGFWAEPAASYTAFKCRSDDVCPGGEVDEDVCGYDRVGRNCALCKEKYYSGSGRLGPCQECADADIVPLTLAILFFVTAPLILHRICNSNEVTARQSDSMILAAVMGQVISYSQIFSMVGTFHVAWPPELQSIFDFYHFFMLRLELFRPSCMFGSWGFESEYLSGLLMPFLFAGIYVAEYFIVLLLSKVVPSIKALNWNMMCNTLGRTFQVFHVAILKQATTVLECYEHPNGERSLVMFPEVICGGSAQLSVMPVTGIVLFLYCVVFLGYLCWVAYVAPSRFCKKSFANQHRYLLLKFRPDKWYWAVPLFLRNTILAFIIAMAPDFPIIQICLFNFVMMIFLALTLSHAPWKDPKNNMLDAALTMILMVFSLAALPLAPMDNRLLWPLTMIMILAVAMEVALVGGLLLLLSHQIYKQFRRESQRNKKGLTAVVPESRAKQGNYQDDYQPSETDSYKEMQEMKKKLAASVHHVCKHMAQSPEHSVNEFLANLTIYDAKLVQKFTRLIQTELMEVAMSGRKSEQRLPYKTFSNIVDEKGSSSSATKVESAPPKRKNSNEGSLQGS